MEIKIKYFEHEIPESPFGESYKVEEILPFQGGDWIDLRAAETVDLESGDYYQIPLGVGMILPVGYEAHVVPRSSTFKNWGIILANSFGVIDNSYSGDADEWRFPAIALRDTHIERGDRIAQFRIVENMPSVFLKTVDHLNEISRGGIGSTGKA